MIYISLYNSKTCWVPRFFEISNRSLQCLQLSNDRLCLLFQSTIEDLFTRPAVNRVILLLSAHSLLGSKEFILFTYTILITLSHTGWFAHLFKARVDTATSLKSVLNISPYLSECFTLSTGVQKKAPIPPFKIQ